MFTDEGEQTSVINIEGIFGWIASNIIPIGIAIVGLAILFDSKRGRLSDGLGQLMVVILGLIVFFGAVLIATFGDVLSGIIFSTPTPAG